MKKLFLLLMLCSNYCISMQESTQIYPCKSIPLTIHKDFYLPLKACLQRNKMVEDFYCGDFLLSHNLCTVNIMTKDMIYPDKNSDRFHAVLNKQHIGKNAQKKLKNIIAAFTKLSGYRVREHISYKDDGTIEMIAGWRSVFCPDIMEYFYILDADLPKLCAIAKLRYIQ